MKEQLRRFWARFSWAAAPLEFSNGSLTGVQANDIVENCAQTTNYAQDVIGPNGEYYIVGSIDIPEGLATYDALVASSDPYRQSFAYFLEYDTPEGSATAAFIGCIEEWEYLIESVFNENPDAVYSERFDLYSPKKRNRYYGFLEKHTGRNEYNGYYYDYAYAYVETGAEGKCVLVMLNYKSAYREDRPGGQEMMDTLEMCVDRINPVIDNAQ